MLGAQQKSTGVQGFRVSGLQTGVTLAFKLELKAVDYDLKFCTKFLGRF